MVRIIHKGPEPGGRWSLEPGKVVFSHPNEPVGAAEPSLQDRIFLKQPDDLAFCEEVAAPRVQRFGIVDAKRIDVACDQKPARQSLPGRCCA
jgi:hypothetical protein